MTDNIRRISDSKSPKSAHKKFTGTQATKQPGWKCPNCGKRISLKVKPHTHERMENCRPR